VISSSRRGTSRILRNQEGTIRLPIKVSITRTGQDLQLVYAGGTSLGGQRNAAGARADDD